MAKKKLILNEGATRRFMKLASVKPVYVSNFLKEADDMEEEPEEGMEDEAPMGMDDEAPMDAEMDMEPPMEDEAQLVDAEKILLDILGAVKVIAGENGVTLDVEGSDADMGDEEMDMDMDAEMAPDAELEGGDPELSDEEPAEIEDAEANRMYEEAEKDLDASGVEVVDEEKIVAEVTRRVARRLLRESAKSRK